VRLGRKFVSYAVKVVDGCGEDDRPSSGECVGVAVCLWLTRRSIEWNGSQPTRSWRMGKGEHRTTERGNEFGWL
jgi:hypothetical protein